ncbi:MAG: alpha/beta fold hydrolase [Leptospira sp.]|nr:alpha/beta fold hydrolase [Leptospira sp.]
MSNTSFQIKARDGYLLTCTYFEASNSKAQIEQVIMIYPAVGVKRGFYGPLAKYLSQSGFHVYTIDYRGMGDSGDPKLVNDGMYTWATLDMNALQMYVSEKHKKADYHIIGHSGGGWLLGFIKPLANLKSLTFLNVGDGYFNSFPFPKNLQIYLSWKFLIPYAIKKHGVLPTSKSYYGTTLPKNIALDWATYGLKKDFIEDFSLNPRGAYLSAYMIPKLAISFSDDEVLGIKSIKSILKKLDANDLTHVHVQPKEIGEKEMGHFGFLKPGQRKNLWPRLVEWIQTGKFPQVKIETTANLEMKSVRTKILKERTQIN